MSFNKKNYQEIIMNRMLISICTLILVILSPICPVGGIGGVGGGFLYAQIPRTISYQGILTDAAGIVKPDGNYSITFSFYESEAGGNAIWSETKTLSTAKGLFSTSLGSQTPFNATVKFDKPYWLGIKVGADAELSPRIALTSVGYSLTADNVVDGKVVKSLNGLKDNVTFEGGGGTTINTDGNKITISSSGIGGTGIQGVQNTNSTLDVTNPNGPTATVNLKVPLVISGSGEYYTLRGYNTGNGGGIWGETWNPNASGVVGFATSGGWGVYGNSPTGSGVVGTSNTWTGVYGESVSAFGVWGKSNTGSGIVGESNTWVGVYGQSNDNSGVWGKSTNGYGVYGESQNGDAGGVYGNSNTGIGVVGKSGSYMGVYGESIQYGLRGKGRYGVFGESLDAEGWAGYFVGKVSVFGDFYANTKNFKIDHPLDPANKYLIHSCVESSERKNIYDGNVITDANGLAIVELPGYFEALNIDYRYQLTTIGQPAQAWIESEIQNNHFVIRTDKPNLKVSWQVTGIRDDPYAKNHPFIVEQEKDEKDKGKYLRPELFGQPEEKGINNVKPPELVNKKQ